MPIWADTCVAVLLLVGVLAALVGAWGLLRLPDFMTRLHAPTKAASLGAGCALGALTLRFYFVEGGGSLRYLIPLAFIFITAPVSAHMLARASRIRSAAESAGNRPKA